MPGPALSSLVVAVGPLLCAPSGGPGAGSPARIATTAPARLPAVAGVAGVAALQDAHGSLKALYEAGRPFREFLERAERRKELWSANYAAGEPSSAVVERGRRIPRRWRMLAIAEDGCSDSVHTIPYLARLAERVDGIELRIIDSRAGRQWMEARRTPDGRAATPTVLILDEAFEEAGCWIERPSALQTWALENGSRLSGREFLERKMAWYAEDAGRSTVAEVLGVIEAAASGARICDD